jgi:hypothetical protein
LVEIIACKCSRLRPSPVTVGRRPQAAAYHPPMPKQRRPAVPGTPPREPKELAAALREPAAQTEES